MKIYDSGVLLLLLLIGCSRPEAPKGVEDRPRATSATMESNLPFDPRSYIVYRADEPIVVDGKLDDEVWQRVPWSDDFIVRDELPTPHPDYLTRMKIAWDDDHIYFAAEMEEPNVWGEATERNSPLHPENAFEIFLDPTGDTHNYLEFQINAIETVWDLFLTKPRGEERLSISTWNMLDYQAAVQVYGEVNNPEVADQKWTVEVAFSWESLRAILQERRPPVPGQQWRVAFMRVVWELDVVDGRYVKRVDPETSDYLPEYKYVWSPQSLSQHIPETWGYIQFSGKVAGEGEDHFVWHRDEEIKWALRLLHYRQLEYYREHGRYSDDPSVLRLDDIQVEGADFRPAIETTRSMYEAYISGFDEGVTWHIRHDGRVWSQQGG